MANTHVAILSRTSIEWEWALITYEKYGVEGLLLEISRYLEEEINEINGKIINVSDVIANYQWEMTELELYLARNVISKKSGNVQKQRDIEGWSEHQSRIYHVEYLKCDRFSGQISFLNWRKCDKK